MRRFKASRERKVEYIAQMEKRMRDDYRRRTGKEAESFCVLWCLTLTFMFSLFESCKLNDITFYVLTEIYFRWIVLNIINYFGYFIGKAYFCTVYNIKTRQ